ncbi:MAG: hypothetical protein WC821_04180 [archaeon]|jgi:hypothetical protein
MTPRLPRLSTTKKRVDYRKAIETGKTQAIWKEQFREQLLNLSEEQRAKMWEKYLTQVRIKRNDIRVKNLAKRAKA